MRSASACAPFMPLLPKKPTCTHAVLSPSWQNSQVPSEIANGITTTSPRLTVRTSAPTSSTTPIASWPMLCPLLAGRHRVVRPEVAAADAGADDAHDRVGGLDDRRVGNV